jgi:hypothetical protein
MNNHNNNFSSKFKNKNRNMSTKNTPVINNKFNSNHDDGKYLIYIFNLI